MDLLSVHTGQWELPFRESMERDRDAYSVALEIKELMTKQPITSIK
jgi:hypothetical protein